MKKVSLMDFTLSSRFAEDEYDLYYIDYSVEDRLIKLEEDLANIRKKHKAKSFMIF